MSASLSHVKVEHALTSEPSVFWRRVLMVNRGAQLSGQLGVLGKQDGAQGRSDRKKLGNGNRFDDVLFAYVKARTT